MVGRKVERGAYALLALRAVALIGLALLAHRRPAVAVLQKAPRRPAPAVPPGSHPGEPRANPTDGLIYVWIPPGTFWMGCSEDYQRHGCAHDEHPWHSVTLTKGFWLGQKEVTVGSFRNFAQSIGASMPPAPAFPQYDNHPVVNVTWDEATAYCRWAGGRLPTEAEWEYAARAGSLAAYYGRPDDIAWFYHNSGGGTHAVGYKAANGFGLHDMLGNVFEWVADWYGASYYTGTYYWVLSNPPGPPTGNSRVVRGGSFHHVPHYLRASCRGMRPPYNREEDLGFRCALEVRP